MSIAKHQAELEEACFYDIGRATTAQQLHDIEAIIDAVTPDEDARAELRRQIQMRREQFQVKSAISCQRCGEHLQTNRVIESTRNYTHVCGLCVDNIRNGL